MARITTPRTQVSVPARAPAAATPAAAWGVREDGRLIWRWTLRSGR